MAKKGHIPWNKGKKGFQGFWKGKKLTKEHRRKLSLAHKGYIMPDEQKKKISIEVKKHLPQTAFKKGHTPSNKGKPRPDIIGNIFAKRKHFLKERIAKSERSKGKNNCNWKGGRM